jgi:hypothetical protein
VIFTPQANRVHWLPPTVGLFTAAIVSVLTSAPPARPYSWPGLLAASFISVTFAFLACVLAMRLAYAVMPGKPEGIVVRISAIATCFAPLVILLRQRSILASLLAAFLVWTIAVLVFTGSVDNAPWKKFAGSLGVAILLQLGIAAALGEQSLIAVLALGLAAAPLTWRVLQERSLRGPSSRVTVSIALLLMTLGLTHYLPVHFGFAGGASGDVSGADSRKKSAPVPGFSVGGKYRGVVLIPEEEEHVILVPPLPMMGRNPFLVHKDPIGIPFYGVYWFFQAPDREPNEDAYRVKGTPDHVAFRSADRTPLKMEAHQNLGRLIDIDSCSRIDITVRNADPYAGSISLELILENTSLGEFHRQSLGVLPIVSRADADHPMLETLSFKIPPHPPSHIGLQQFDELTIRFQRASYRATKSAKLAIDRFFLVPRASM